MHANGAGPSGRLRIGIIAPPWVAVPPPGYGGTEAIVDTLARGLQAAGHDVLLFATGDSRCPVPTLSHFDAPSEPFGTTVAELAHVRAAYQALARCDVIHDHTLGGLVWAAARPPTAPVVVTNHSAFTADIRGVFADLADHVSIVAISASQAAAALDVPVAATIHHGVDCSSRAVGPGDGGYLCFVGRMHPDKGVHRAIEIARAAGLPLRIAAKMREPPEDAYFHEVVEPELGRGIEYVGEVSPAERDQLVGEACALINPISWPEPFGMVMIEAFAVGTPVVAYPAGAAPEIVTDGVTGFLVRDVAEAVAAVDRIDTLDRGACRRAAEGPFSARRMVEEHLRLYRGLVAHHRPPGSVIELHPRSGRRETGAGAR